MDSPRAALVEVFDSIQGEGRFAGVPMAFVRVATCPIRCVYCDTPHSYTAAPTFEVRARGHSERVANPADAARVAELVRAVRGGPLVVSVTGGEPLVYPEFVAALGRALGGRLHLETAALDPDALAVALPAVDHVSADYKLPGTLENGDWREANVACVERAVAAGRTVDVKLVLTPAVTDAAVERALDDLAGVHDSIVLVLQPVTPFGAVRERVGADAIARWSACAERARFDVRVLPQLHPTLGLD